jgi:preprotein translocase subunit SecG
VRLLLVHLLLALASSMLMRAIAIAAQITPSTVIATVSVASTLGERHRLLTVLLLLVVGACLGLRRRVLLREHAPGKVSASVYGSSALVGAGGVGGQRRLGALRRLAWLAHALSQLRRGLGAGAALEAKEVRGVRKAGQLLWTVDEHLKHTQEHSKV